MARCFLAIGILALCCGPAFAAVMTVSGTAPTIDNADIGLLTGTFSDQGGNVGHSWSNRPVHGQSFTTGSSSGGYLLDSVTLAARVDQGGGTISPTWDLRVGSISGTTFTPIVTEQATGVTIPNASATNPQWVTWTFDDPIELDPDTEYGFDVDPSGGGFIGLATDVIYAGGFAFSSGSNGTPSNSLTAHSFDRAFQVDMTVAAVPEPSTFALAALALVGIGWFGWRRRQ